MIVDESKYLVGHRWEVMFSDKLYTAFTEMLIYGGRDPELIYFLPTIFLWPVQHNITSKSEDNIAWSFEGQYHLLNGLKIYGTFMIDELRTSEMFKNWSGNRWVMQAGIHSVGDILSLPVDFLVEWTAARPWAYTHRVPLYGTYTHNQRCLGFVHGPNSQLLLLENTWWIDHRNIFIIVYEHLKWGEKPSDEIGDGYHFGNNSNENYLLENPDYHYNTGWLIGDIHSLHHLSLIWEYKLSNMIGIEFEFLNRIEEKKAINAISIQLNLDY